MMDQYTFAGLPACGESTGWLAGIAIIGISHGISYSVGVPSHSVKSPMAIRKAAERYADLINPLNLQLS